MTENTNPTTTRLYAGKSSGVLRQANLRVASWSRKAREATERRDEAIREMRADGATLRAIADAAGLTHTAVAKILRRGQ